MDPTRARALAEALSIGRKAASELASETDGLTEELALLERDVTELKLGVAASVVMRSETQGEDDGPHREWCTELVFERTGKQWRLSVTSGEPGDPETYSSQLLVNSSREDRMRAADVLPELIEKLAEAAVRKRDEVREKAEAVRGVRAVLKQVRGENHE